MKGTVNVPGVSGPELDKKIKEIGGTAVYTADKVLITDAQGKAAASGVAADALSNLTGVTGPIQTQLNNKAGKPVYVPITLTHDGWDGESKEQTVTVSGAVAGNTQRAELTFADDAKASIKAARDAGILIVGKTAGKVTLACDTVPAGSISAYIELTPITV